MSEVVWIRFKATHGPGHQSRRLEYRPFFYEMTEDDVQCELESWSQQFNNVRSEAQVVSILPGDVIKEKIEDYEREMAYVTCVLDDLRKRKRK